MSILLTAMMPRAVLQYGFFVALGAVLVGPAQRDFALVGAPVVALIVAGIMISDVPVTDKWSGTFSAVRIGQPPAFTIILLRCVPYPVFGMFVLVVCVLVVPPLAGRANLSPQLLAWLPLYLLMAVSVCASGLAVAMLALGKRAEVLMSNVLAYLLLVASGVFLPLERVPMSELTAALPARNGLLAVRAALDGEPWWWPALGEAAVATCWLATAYVVARVQIYRAVRDGNDDYS